MSIMIHIYYTGKNGAAKLFADEMRKIRSSYEGRALYFR